MFRVDVHYYVRRERMLTETERSHFKLGAHIFGLVSAIAFATLAAMTYASYEKSDPQISLEYPNNSFVHLNSFALVLGSTITLIVCVSFCIILYVNRASVFANQIRQLQFREVSHQKLLTRDRARL